MKRHLTVLLGLACLVAVARSQGIEQSGCVGCHLEQDPPYSTPAETFESDVHGQAGFTCEVCHGGDPEAWDYDEAKDPARGFIGIPVGRQVVEVCGRCHADPDLIRRYNPNLPTDQIAKYWTSGHGKSLMQGNTEVAQCASCHGTHAIKRSDDPGSPVYHNNVANTCGECHANPLLMNKFDINSQVVAQYRGSVHGTALLLHGDVAAPTCNDCHGNHGAAPPEVGSIQEVCGACHVNNQTLYNQTKMGKMFSTKGMHGCVVCHTAHDIQPPNDSMISADPGGVCGRCHQPSDPGAIQAGQMRSLLDSLNNALVEANRALDEAENRGLEVEDLLFDLQTATSFMIHSRTKVHTYEANKIREEVEPGLELVSNIVHGVSLLMHDFRMRKVGLGIATIFISFLALVLYLYIRTLDKSQ